ncbi:LPS-assembly lipoprotein LptE [Buchnera aphidicola (Neophyllaphis podocarpi)]|uniref:hypothetical protein n=1 Tax=Buchnera aphidicola TaxID=9 RepID=UPI00346441AD
MFKDKKYKIIVLILLINMFMISGCVLEENALIKIDPIINILLDDSRINDNSIKEIIREKFSYYNVSILNKTKENKNTPELIILDIKEKKKSDNLSNKNNLYEYYIHIKINYIININNQSCKNSIKIVKSFISCSKFIYEKEEIYENLKKTIKKDAIEKLIQKILIEYLINKNNIQKCYIN